MHNWPRAAGRHVRDARGPADGRVRHLRDRRDRQGRARGDAAPRARIRCCSPRTRSTRCRRSSSRNLHPLDAGVVSVTQVHGGDTWNVIPQEVVLRGTVRTFKPDVQDLIERRMRDDRRRHRRDVRHDARRCATSAAIRRPSTRADETRHALAAATAVVGADQRRHRPDAGDGQRGFRVHAAGEARLLRLARRGPRARTRPTCTTRTTTSTTTRCAIGASYWVTLAEQQLPRAAA